MPALLPRAAEASRTHTAGTITALLLIAATSAAQRGSFTTFGSSCPQSEAVCFQSNPSAGKLTLPQTFTGNLFAFPFTTGARTVVTGCEFYMRAIGRPTTVGVYLFASDVFGKPMGGLSGSLGLVVGAVASSTMAITTNPGWYRATFPSPVVLDAGARYFIGYISNSNAFMMPIVTPGTVSPHYFLPRGGGWSGPFVTRNWAWKVVCAQPGVPALSFGSSFPVPGQLISFDLTNAPANAPAVLALGSSNQRFGPFALPFDLTQIGAPSCLLHVSIDATLPTVANLAGSATSLLQVPFWLAPGSTFHTQWLVVAPGANPLGVVTSNAGTVSVGR